MTKPAKRNKVKSKGQRREQIERKRDERSQKNNLKKEREAKDYIGDKGDFNGFQNQLQREGFKMRDVIGDGNCLFRALADQLNGNQNLHGKHRVETVHYMELHKEDFAPFIDETVSFKKYLENLSCLGTYGGNDSIVAFARNNSTDIIIHQLNNPTFIIKGSHLRTSQTVPPTVIIHLAYHDFQHYSSVRRINDPGNGPAYTYHKEEDSVASTTNTSQENDRKVTAEKEKNKNAKVRKITEKQNRNMQNVENINNEDNPLISEVVDKIKNDTGFQDSEYIRNTFVEHSYDIDSTLSYFIQIMTLGDNQCYVKGVATSPIHDVANIEGSEEFNQQNQNQSISESVKKQFTCSNLGNDERKKCTDDIKLKHFPHDESNIEKSKCTCNMEGSKSQCFHNNEKINSTVTKINMQKPSNRQRKELAKQARKKRRHDSKKNVDADESPLEQTNDGIQSISI